jgi:hypothetical protein
LTASLAFQPNIHSGAQAARQETKAEASPLRPAAYTASNLLLDRGAVSHLLGGYLLTFFEPAYQSSTDQKD